MIYDNLSLKTKINSHFGVYMKLISALVSLLVELEN